MISVNDIEKKYGNETALFILLIRVFFNAANPGDVNTYIGQKKIDWLLLEKMIRVHQLHPFVYNIVSRYSIQVDAGFYSNIRNTATRIATGNLQRLNELLRLHKLFNINNIPNIPYKGVLLSEALFNDFISRETSDVDFMIRPGSFGAVYKLLLKEGYKAQYYYTPEYRKLFLASDCEMLFVKETGGMQVKVEIHWEVTHKMMDVNIPVGVLFAQSESKNILGTDVKVLDKQSLLMVLLIHHGVNDIWRTLRHVVDIALFTQQFSDNVDWAGLKRQADKYHIGSTVQTGFALCREICGIEIPGEFVAAEAQVQKVLHNMLRFPPVKREKLAFENIRQQFFMRDSFIGKTRLFMAYLLTSLSPNMRDVEHNKLPPRWSFLYTIIKPFRLLMGISRKSNTA